MNLCLCEFVCTELRAIEPTRILEEVRNSVKNKSNLNAGVTSQQKAERSQNDPAAQTFSFCI